MDWDHARVFLAVARSGQMLAAARKLGLDHATVSRRLATLEASLKAKLVERSTAGCVLTPAGEHFLAAAERIEHEMLQVQTSLGNADLALAGAVRVGAPDGFGSYFLAPRFGAFIARHPDLTIQLVPLPRTFSLSRHEADIAVTLERPEKGRLVSRSLTDYRLSLYASRDYLASAPPLASKEDLPRHTLVTYVDDLMFSRALDYGAELAALMPRRFECAGVTGQVEAVRAGVGIGILHDYAARSYPDLQVVLPDVTFTRSYWLVMHAEGQKLRRVTAVADFIAGEVRANRRLFS
ncbi:LysR family transcriptional regulator [Chelatococcus sp. GCM10030263]|uniref:LysR family transcriptional regulator n=1 Tax=Chelatococcus sp. GCM10030263 TaxID=3273387 RepID=UPI003622F6F7